MAQGRDINDVVNWDVFFYRGETNDLDLECRHDLFELLLQKSRSLFYYRRGSAGVSNYENNPNAIQLQVLCRFDIASAVSYRNSLVSDGSDSNPDRRIAVSQNSIGFQQVDENLTVDVYYFLYANYEEIKNITIPFLR